MKPFNGYKYSIILLIILCIIFTISCSNIVASTTVAEIKIPETTQSTTTITSIAQTATSEAPNKFKGLNIELISDPNLPKAQFIGQDGKTYIPKDVVYNDSFEGPKKMEEALLMTWALTLKKQTKHPAFANIDEKDGEALLSTLRDLLNKGEVPIFEIKLKKNWSLAAGKASRYESYKVDMTKGVKLKFVGEMTNIVTYEDFYNPSFDVVKDWVDSREFFWITRASKNRKDLLSGNRIEIANDGALTITTFCKYPDEGTFCYILGITLETIINQKFTNEEYLALGKERKPIILIENYLFDGNEWDTEGKWLKFGAPIITRIY